jgi:hypothetical protein
MQELSQKLTLHTADRTDSTLNNREALVSSAEYIPPEPLASYLAKHHDPELGVSTACPPLLDCWIAIRSQFRLDTRPGMDVGACVPFVQVLSMNPAEGTDPAKVTVVLLRGNKTTIVPRRSSLRTQPTLELVDKTYHTPKLGSGDVTKNGFCIKAVRILGLFY